MSRLDLAMLQRCFRASLEAIRADLAATAERQQAHAPERAAAAAIRQHSAELAGLLQRMAADAARAGEQ